MISRHYVRLCLFACLVLIRSSTATQAAYLLVAGRESDNVVRFDIETGVGSLYATYALPSDVRGLAIDSLGQLYSSTDGGHNNVVRFVPQVGTSVLTSVDFTSSVGNFGPGQIQFYAGDLYAAGGTERAVIQFDGASGAEIRRFGVTDDFNIRGLTVTDDMLYYVEIFQERVRKMDLSQTPPTGGTLIEDVANLSEPTDMIVGGNGNLYITNRASTLVQEFDISTGAFVRTLADLHTFDPTLDPDHIGLAYEPSVDSYFIAAGDAVYRVNAGGTLLQTYQSPLLSGAYGIVAVPEPQGLVLAIWSLLGSLLWNVRRGHHFR